MFATILSTDKVKNAPLLRQTDIQFCHLLQKYWAKSEHVSHGRAPPPENCLKVRQGYTLPPGPTFVLYI